MRPEKFATIVMAPPAALLQEHFAVRQEDCLTLENSVLVRPLPTEKFSWVIVGPVKALRILME